MTTAFDDVILLHRALFSDAEIIDFVSILGDLGALDHLSEFSTATSKVLNTRGPPAVQPRSSGPRTWVDVTDEDPLTGFDYCDAVLRGTLLETQLHRQRTSIASPE